MSMSDKKLSKELSWLIERSKEYRYRWNEELLENHSHSADGFVLIDAGIVKSVLVDPIEFLERKLEELKKNIESSQEE